MTGPSPPVCILMGSKSDWSTLVHAKRTLDALGIENEARVLSAHRTPHETAAYVRERDAGGTKVFIAAAGMAAHLAGAVAAQTSRPVIGVPLPGPHLDGLDALLATVQMPRGVPVATVTVGKHGAINAGLLAAQILSVADHELAKRLQAHKAEQARAVLDTTLED